MWNVAHEIIVKVWTQVAKLSPLNVGWILRLAESMGGLPLVFWMWERNLEVIFFNFLC